MAEGPDATVINDRYEVRRRVGRGGMADVFMAHDLLLNRDIAVKVLFPDFGVRLSPQRASATPTS
jgi:serine/threonine protein kinase